MLCLFVLTPEALSKIVLAVCNIQLCQTIKEIYLIFEHNDVQVGKHSHTDRLYPFSVGPCADLSQM